MAEQLTATETPAATPHLRRVLGLGDLISIGIVIVQTIAAVTLYGIAEWAQVPQAFITHGDPRGEDNL